MSEDLKPLRDKLNSLHDRIPEGEYKQELVSILQELNRIEGVTGDEDSDAAKTGIEVPKKKVGTKGL